MILLSIGFQGVLLQSDSVVSGTSFAYGSSDEERLEWSALPCSINVLNPFLLSVLSDSSIEVHDLATLVPLQRISISSPSPHVLSLSLCVDDPSRAGPNPNFSYHAFISNGEQLSVLKMIPLSAQVNAFSCNLACVCSLVITSIRLSFWSTLVNLNRQLICVKFVLTLNYLPELI